MTADTAEGTKGNGMRDRAQTVIVGAGIVGASAAYHLAELGSTDVLVIDQGPLFETGGSTSHAPGLVFQTNGSRTMCRIAQDTVRLYGSLELDGLPGWYGVGGIEVATTPERMAELRRRQGFARSYGIADTHLLSPDEAAERIPLLDPNAILGAYLVPSDGIAKAVRIVTALAGKASARGVTFEGGVPGHRLRHPGRPRARRGDRPRPDRVRARADLRGDLGADRGRAGRRAGAARRGAAPAGVDGPDPRAVGRDARGRASDPPSPGSRDVLPAPRGPLRRGQLPPRADRHAAARHPPSRRRADAVADAVHTRGLRRRPNARPSGCSRRSPVVCGPPIPNRSINGMFSFTPDAGSIVGESAHGPRPLALRGGVGHARRRDGPAGRRVDGERRARVRPGRGRREPLLPVPDHAAVRPGARRAAVPRGLRHPASAATDDGAAEAPADAVLRATHGARRGVLHRRGVGASAVVRGEPRAAHGSRLGAS